MESTMCHDDGVDYSATSSPSPVYTLFFMVRYNKHCLAFFFFFAAHKGWRMQPHLSVLAARVSPFASLFALLCAQDTLYSSISHESSSSHSWPSPSDPYR